MRSVSIESLLVITFLVALVVGWLLLAYKEPPIKGRDTADYRHQQTENPDYSTPSGGGQGGI